MALQILSVADGRIDAGDERRFYAPVPSEHWNQATPYWLTDEDRPGQRFEHWDRAPGTAPPRTTEQEAERWQPRTIYHAPHHHVLYRYDSFAVADPNPRG